MKTLKNLIVPVLLLLAAITTSGQNSPLSEEYTRLADDFKKNLQPDNAVIYYEKASVEFQKLGNIEQFVNSYNQIGTILTRQDKYERARTYLEKALSTGLSSLGPNHLLVASTYITLGVIEAAEKKYDQSLIYHNKALSIRLLKLGETNGEVATSYGNIGNVYLRAKDLDKSVDAHSKAMKIREKVFGTSSVEIIDSYIGLGNAYREKKDYKASLPYFLDALKNKLIQRGPGHKDLARFYTYISEVCYLMGDKGQGDLFKVKAEGISKS